mmetsp:Transcript_98117/g.245966  ORF Transcript_98117/g.245966 Transcript_98117/m.245966 type:complete len:504 (-) Transcript_98117:65-1576(-)
MPFLAWSPKQASRKSAPPTTSEPSRSTQTNLVETKRSFRISSPRLRPSPTPPATIGPITIMEVAAHAARVQRSPVHLFLLLLLPLLLLPLLLLLLLLPDTLRLAIGGLTNPGLTPGRAPPRPQHGGYEGCRGVYAKRKGRAAAAKGPTHHAALVCKLLQKMNGTLRRQVIEKVMQQDQRLALEAYMRSEREGLKAACAAKPDHNPGTLSMLANMPCESTSSDEAESEIPRGRGHGGICKSAEGARVYGYYAKVGIRNLIFCTRIHRELKGAVRDHIILSRILEHIRCEGTRGHFPTVVRTAVASVLFEEGLMEGEFLRSVGVTFSAQPWIGRGLYVHCQQLGRALEAWRRLESAKGAPLFKGARVTSAFTPERLEEQWCQVREVFIQLQTKEGQIQRSQVEAFLAALEARYRPVFARKAARWWQQWQRAQVGGAADRVNAERALLRRCERAIRTWRQEAAREVRRKQRAEAQEQKMRWAQMRKRCWNGVEPIAEFERRVHGRR